MEDNIIAKVGTTYWSVGISIGDIDLIAGVTPNSFLVGLSWQGSSLDLFVGPFLFSIQWGE